MKQKRIAAFTLSELMVVLVVSSIVVTIAFFALSSVQKQVRSIQQTYEKQQEIQFIERLLLGDLNTHEGYYDDKKKVLLLTNSRDSVQYYFDDHIMTRNKDTMRLKVVSKVLYREGKEIKKGSIDAIELQFSNTFSIHSIFVSKMNDASHYIHN